MKTASFLVATFFGIGKIPLAPGTWASLAAVPCFYPLIHRPLLHATVLVLVYFAGVFACSRLERDLGEQDPSCAVIDEVLGMGVTLLLIPDQWQFLVMAVIFFRLFDIWKPYPIKKLEKLPGGWGVMTDDLLAGAYALFFLQIGSWFVQVILK